MSIKLATLIVFVISIAGSFVHCNDEEIDWGLYGEYIISIQDRFVQDLSTYAFGVINARNPCYTFLSTVGAAIQSGPNVNRYQIRFRVRYPSSDGDGFYIGQIDVVADYATVDNDNERFQIISVSSRGNIEP